MTRKHLFLGQSLALGVALAAGCALDAQAPEPVRREHETSIAPRSVRPAARRFEPVVPCVGPRCEAVVEVAAGRAHTCAVMSSGRVLCWGSGDGVPRAVAGVPDAIAIGAGGDRSCVVRTGGAVWCWSGASGSIAKVTGIEDAATVAVSDRMVVAALGDGSVRESRAGRTRIVRGARDIVEVDVRDDRACARSDAGELGCWLDGDERVTPVAVEGVRSVALGERHQCVIVGGHEVRCWGDDEWGMVGTSSGGIVEEPTAVPEARGALTIAAGAEHTCVLLPGTEVRCWGRNQRGQVDPSTRAFDDYNVERTPVVVAAFAEVHDVIGLALGAEHTCVTRARGGVSCWGANREGQLGDGTTDARETPANVRGLRVTGTRPMVE